MNNKSVWVIGFNKNTGVKEVYTICPMNNAKFYEQVYIGKGYDVKIMTGEDVEEMLEKEDRK